MKSPVDLYQNKMTSKISQKFANNCPWVFNKGEKKGQTCGKRCLNSHCSDHMKCVKKVELKSAEPKSDLVENEIKKHTKELVRLLSLIKDKDYLLKVKEEIKREIFEIVEEVKEPSPVEEVKEPKPVEEVKEPKPVEEKKEEKKEDRLEYHKEYYQKNKEKVLEYRKQKVMCECGIESSKRHIARHRTSKAHIEAMKEIEKEISK